MTGFHNLHKPFFRSDYGMVFCLMVLMGYLGFVILPAAPGGGAAIRWAEIWGVNLIPNLVATGLLMGALSALLLHLYQTSEKGSAGEAALRWGGLLAAVMACVLLFWPLFGVERSVANVEPMSPTTATEEVDHRPS
jgi:hypothetical protein